MTQTIESTSAGISRLHLPGGFYYWITSFSRRQIDFRYIR
jgi:hypothetical protein